MEKENSTAPGKEKVEKRKRLRHEGRSPPCSVRFGLQFAPARGMVPAENGRTVRKENWQAMKIGNRVAVLVPCHNEAATVGKVVDDFRKALPEATVYVYDNNSTDDTAARAREAGAGSRRGGAQRAAPGEGERPADDVPGNRRRLLRPDGRR